MKSVSINKIFHSKKLSLRKNDRIVEALKKELSHPYITTQGLARIDLSERGHSRGSTSRDIEKASDD